MKRKAPPNKEKKNKKIKIGEEYSVDGKPAFRDGAIVRVKIKNFMTYDDCEFFPGPGLNLVLGPNGTGKSSIVAALCLGLNGNPKVMGRASSAKDYIKHGKEKGTTEIELYRAEKNNIIITRTFTKHKSNNDENQSFNSVWKIDGDVVNSETIKKLVEGLNIQLDNLTQFLPQDKVCEFSTLSPKELLIQTETAVLPPEIVKLHDDLIEKKKSFSKQETVKTKVKKGSKRIRSRNRAIKEEE
jgi:structural maintenance of chromosomes protein 5